MPRTLGNVTPDARPWRVCSSERFSPNALTSMRTQPSGGVGTGRSRVVNASGGPGASRTTARMVWGIQASWALVLARALVYNLTRSPGAADPSMAAIASWTCTHMTEELARHAG